MKNVLVTGGAGFIGSALIRVLLEEPGVERVVALDNLLTGHERNLAEVKNRIEFHNADIRDLASLERLFAEIDVVFHQAAIPSVPRSINDPQLTHEVNIDGTFNVLLAAQRRKVSRVVYAASSSAYGVTEVLPKSETLAPRPKSPYAVQKLVGEYYARTFFDNYGLDTVCLRYFNVFGPRQDPASPYSGVISLFCTAALGKQAPMIFGDGEQTRDFTYVDNIVQLNLLAARSPKAPGNVYNGGVGARITLNELWSKFQELEGLDLPPRYQPGRAGDIRDSQADLGAARRDLRYEPRIDLSEGLRRTLAWYRASG
jgi:UDP-glucose 4-epimerase